MFADDARRLPMHPAGGMQVRVFGHLTLYEQQGAYQLKVQLLEAEAGGGLHQLRFEQIKKKLVAEGLLPKPRKRSLPRFPMTVGVVTSQDGAALQDVLNVIRRRAPWTRVIIGAAKVQGDGAARTVVRAMRGLYKLRVDVIMVVRGGGSKEELWTFNDEELARAIAKCPIPVITGIGHQTDESISDLVSDVYAVTPSAAAEAVVQDRQALDREFRSMASRMANATKARVRLVQRQLTTIQNDLTYDLKALHKRRSDKLLHLAGKLEALSPLALLARGYSVAQDEDGNVLRRVAEFKKNFVLRVSDGRVQATVNDTTKS